MLAHHKRAGLTNKNKKGLGESRKMHVTHVFKDFTEFKLKKIRDS